MSTQGLEYITEGSVEILNQGVVGKIDGDKPETNEDTLFYNPAQVFNRDLSMLVVKTYATKVIESAFLKFNNAAHKKRVNPVVKGLNICEPLGASGIRSMRYAKELPSSTLSSCTVNDISEYATAQCKKNLEHNLLTHRVKTKTMDGNYLLYKQMFEGSDQFDVIDMDPYGSISPFLDSCVRTIKDGGLLCLTSTDMPVLGGNVPEVAFYKYGGTPVKSRCLHEMSVRLVLYTVVMAAAKYRRYVAPLMSLSVDFYVRIFVRVMDKPLSCTSIGANSAIVYQCVNCDWFSLNPLGAGAATRPNEKREKRRKKQADPLSVASGQNGAEPIEEGDKNALPTVHLFKGAESTDRYTTGRLCSGTLGDKCPECANAIWMAGPIYAGPMHDLDFVNDLLAELKKDNKTSKTHDYVDCTNFPIESNEILESNVIPSDLQWVIDAENRFNLEKNSHTLSFLDDKVKPKLFGTLHALQEELLDVPLYYNISSLCNQAKCEPIKTSMFRNALTNMGYRVGVFHRDPWSIKTDAPSYIVFDIMREWVKNCEAQSGPNKNRPDRFKRAHNSSTPQITFLPDPNVVKGDKLPKFIPNPQRCWGPGRRAGGAARH